jgi:hypothetical protein
LPVRVNQLPRLCVSLVVKMLICKLRFIGAGDSKRRGVLGLCMEGELA